MTAADLTPLPDEEAQTTPVRVPFFARVEERLERASEWLNPILVKEARQALKSRQFVITFSLLLICAWGWSILGVAANLPDIYFAPRAPEMLMGYFLILALPLFVIVPFTAFRSLAAEREDGTFELLSITALKARQIIGGKLGSAVLQMLVYFSALAPCIAFTYMLRGIDVISILLILSHAFLISLFLSALGLLLATVSRATHWNVVLSVLFLIVLLMAGWMSCAFVIGLVLAGEVVLFTDEPMFWMGDLTLLTAAGSYILLFYLAAAARISFASENRSTRLRWVMLLQQMLIVGWSFYYWLVSREHEFLYVCFMLSAMHWYLMGSLMVGETAELSERVKRGLPQSLTGRMFLTWFNPGSGTGYFFAVTNMLTVFVVGAVAIKIAFELGYVRSWVSEATPTWFGLILLCYVIVYLGVGRLIVLLMARFSRTGPFVSFLVHVLLLLLGVLVPWVVQVLVTGEGRDYMPLQAPNWAWTLDQVIRDRRNLLFDDPVNGLHTVPMLLIVSAGMMLVLNFVLTANEVRQERQAQPERIEQEELALHPERLPKPPVDPFGD